MASFLSDIDYETKGLHEVLSSRSHTGSGATTHTVIATRDFPKKIMEAVRNVRIQDAKSLSLSFEDPCCQVGGLKLESTGHLNLHCVRSTAHRRVTASRKLYDFFLIFILFYFRFVKNICRFFFSKMSSCRQFNRRNEGTAG